MPAEILASAETRAAGRTLYLRHCALCHGRDADGRGERRSNLTGRPVDFTDRRWREAVTSGYARTVIREGKEGTSMPAFGSLHDEDVDRLVAYLLSVAEE